MDQITMKMDPIKGESQLDGFKEEIEILSYSHGVSMQVTGDVSNTERTSGRPNVQDFTLTKYADLATNVLNQACCEGTIFKSAVITLSRNDSGTSIKLMTYTLENVVISSISIGGGGGDKPVETLSLNFAKIEWNYIAQKESGGGAGNVPGTWDIALNKAA